MPRRDDGRLGRSWRRRLSIARALAGQCATPAVPLPAASAPKPGVAPLGNAIPGTCPKRDKLTEHQWKKGREEPQAAIETAQEWAKRTAPLYNKGGMQVISSGDAKFLGKK